MIYTDGKPTIAHRPAPVAVEPESNVPFDCWEADLERSAGDGFRVRLFLVPDLVNPESATVEVVHGNVLVDVLTDLSVAGGLLAYQHTALYSSVYAEAVR